MTRSETFIYLDNFLHFFHLFGIKSRERWKVYPVSWSSSYSIFCFFLFFLFWKICLPGGILIITAKIILSHSFPFYLFFFNTVWKIQRLRAILYRRRAQFFAQSSRFIRRDSINIPSQNIVNLQDEIDRYRYREHRSWYFLLYLFKLLGPIRVIYRQSATVIRIHRPSENRKIGDRIIGITHGEIIRESVVISSFFFHFSKIFKYILLRISREARHSFQMCEWKMVKCELGNFSPLKNAHLGGLIYDESTQAWTVTKTAVLPPLSSINLSANLTRSFFSLLKNRRNRF